MRRIYLDMDGVVVDFMRGLAGAFAMPDPYDRPESFGKYNPLPLMGIPDNLGWAPCQHANFWEFLHWMPDGREILALCEGFADPGEVYLCTRPCRGGDGAWAGKVRWVNKHLPRYSPRLIRMMPCKSLLAGSGVLVDDFDAAIDNFTACGGQAVLVPRPWNRGHALRDQAAERVKIELEGFCSAAYQIPEIPEK